MAYRAGGQADFTHEVPTDTGTLLFHYSRPTNYGAVSGSFHGAADV